MRVKYIPPRRVFRSHLDYKDYPVHFKLVDSMFPRLPQPVKLIIVAKYMYGYSTARIAERCSMSKTTVIVAINQLHAYDNIIHPVPLKQAL